jgi:hypothetical protein
MKYTYEEAIRFLTQDPENDSPENYMYSWSKHEYLGKVTVLSETIEDYYEGNVTAFKVVQFENCEEPIGYSYCSNSWNDYDSDEPGTFCKVEKRLVEVWCVKKES